MPTAAENEYQRPEGYPQHYGGPRWRSGSGPGTDHRERRAIQALLATLDGSVGSRPWLDMPSGAGRLSRALPQPVLQVDRDPAMVAASPVPGWKACASGLHLPFPAGAFSGALCLRLMQHLADRDQRLRVLAELRRVTAGPLIVSFFDRCSLQHGRRVLRRWLGNARSNRGALSRSGFHGELRFAGWQPVRTVALLRFFSEQTLVLAR